MPEAAKQKSKAEAVPEAMPRFERQMVLLEPIASDEKIIESFKRFVTLKDKLLEETDYTWFAVYRVSDDNKKKGFQHRADAERAVAEFKEKGIVAVVEKKIKKSGCLKLGKAFGISVEILAGGSTTGGVSSYRVRATAPNGQSAERTGFCDREERGKQQSPMDHLDSIALTRATNRAIMALLGGENTAEEFDEPEETEKSHGVIMMTTGEEKNPEVVSHPSKRPEKKTKEELSADLDKAFANKKPASADPIIALRRKMFGAAKKAGVSEELLKRSIRDKWGTESTKDLTETQLTEAIKILEKKATEKKTA